MTIMSTRSAELSVAELVTTAFERAGLKNEAENLDEAQAAKGRRELKIILDSLSKHGKVSRLVVATPVTLVTDQQDYTLDVGTIDVNGIATLEHLTLTPMTREEMMQLDNNETGSSAPQRYFVDRTGAQVSLHLWPAPSPEYNGLPLNIQREVFRADISNATATPDLERYWIETITWRLTSVLCFSAGLMVRYGAAKGESDAALELALGSSRPRASGQVMPMLPNLWRGGRCR
jgi:hypothetical protein